MWDEFVGQGETGLFAQVRPRCAPPPLSLCPVDTGRGKPADKCSYGTVRMIRRVMLCPLSLFAFEIQPHLAQVSLIILIGVSRA